MILLALAILLPTPGSAQAHKTETIRHSDGTTVVMQEFNMEIDGSAGSALSLASMLDKPAGRDGFISVADGHLVKPSGERFRIWGFNIASGANFAQKEDAVRLADYLARLGVNAVRFHFMDIDSRTGRGLFHNGLDNTRVLSAEELDKVDYLIAELKKRGIYSNINLNTGRTYREGDGVDHPEWLGLAKGATLFDPHLIELEKEYARNLLTHVNPYTGNAYIDEPSVICVEIVNENSLVEAWFSGRLIAKHQDSRTGTWDDITPYYGKVLDGQYNRWLRENYTPADLAVLTGEAGVKSGEDIPRLNPEQFDAASDFRFSTESKFIIQTERKFYDEMYSYLKDSLGVHSMVAANSDHNHYEWGYALLSNLSRYDFVDGHVYWHDYKNWLGDEPGHERWGRKDNLPMVSVPEISTVARLSRSAVEGLPFTISELNNGSYNDYFCEGIPVVGSYGAFQDWDGFYFFALAQREPELWPTARMSGLDMVWDPVRLANFTAYSLAFTRGDIKPAGTTVYRGFSEAELAEGIRNPGGSMPFFTEGFSHLTPMRSKTRVASFTRSIHDFPAMPDRKCVTSDTGELTWRADEQKSLVTIQSPCTEAAVGFMSEAPGKLGHMDVKVSNSFAAVTLTSLDGKPICNAGSLLLVATARARIMGERPTMVEVVSGTVTISGLEGAKTVALEALDGAGNPIRKVKYPVRKGTVSLPLGSDVTVWYRLTVK